jgi:hypothetical protein
MRKRPTNPDNLPCWPPGSTLGWPVAMIRFEDLFPHGLEAALNPPRPEHHPTASEIRGNCIGFPFKPKASR